MEYLNSAQLQTPNLDSGLKKQISPLVSDNIQNRTMVSK